MLATHSAGLICNLKMKVLIVVCILHIFPLVLLFIFILLNYNRDQLSLVCYIIYIDDARVVIFRFQTFCITYVNACGMAIGVDGLLQRWIRSQMLDADESYVRLRGLHLNFHSLFS